MYISNNESALARTQILTFPLPMTMVYYSYTGQTKGSNYDVQPRIDDLTQTQITLYLDPSGTIQDIAARLLFLGY